MAGLAWVWPSDTTRCRKPAMIGASAAAHAVVLGFIALRVLDVDPVRLPQPPHALYLEIEPRPLLEDERPRPRTAPPTPAVAPQTDRPVAATGPARSILGFRLPFQRDREDSDRPSPPPPRPVMPASGAAPTPAAPANDWMVRPETMGERVGRGLRTRGPGCASPRLLTDAERAVCEDRFGERAAAAAPIGGTGDPERDARFARQGARELSRYAERREVRAAERPVCDKSGPIGDCEVEISVDLFSSIDGFLPNLRRED